ncbi:GPI alpha-mannosyltransferase III [Trypanosoma conorhini]|uniref:Mannosyltransferase n=1 Tax=Trypanosoma conorhini TaxID=83891 RepID=A0A422PJK2_9TRYP|nr:GPI alpha-mannosyltransferase III [Trypanosoma conorhini]RNF17908.1 GPI alpha-mannosyltransferase III [Trypanosoma conorhini]
MTTARRGNSPQQGNRLKNQGGAPGITHCAGGLPRLPWYGLFLIFLYRLLLCLGTKTAESPDEWWQSTEIAYYIVFGKGHLSWEWHAGLRPVIFPGMLAVPFFLLKILGLDSTWAVWFIARFVQAFVVTAIDFFVFRLGALLDVELRKATKNKQRTPDLPNPIVHVSMQGLTEGRKLGRSVAYFALLLSLSNWYMAFVGVRVYGNVLEALLALMAVQATNYVGFLLLSGLACAIRATSGIVLFPLLFIHAFWAVREGGLRRGLMHITFRGLLIFMLVFGALVLCDSLFYGRLIITPIVFLRFNVLQNASRFFGEHPWYFYLFPSLPGLLGPHFIFTLFAPLVLYLDKTSRAVKWHIFGLFCVIVWPIFCYSLISHKENRFILPVMPFFFVVTAFVLARWYDKSRAVRGLHRAFIVVNVTLALVGGFVHRRGALDAMSDLRSGPRVDRVDIVAPCYTTPGYSFVHGKVNHLGLIDCPVHLNAETGLPELTEDSVFRRHPKDYVLWKYDGTHTFNVSYPEQRRKADELRRVVSPRSAPYPDVIVAFRDTAKKIRWCFLEKHGYKLYRSFFHTPLSLEPCEDVYLEMWVRKIVKNG